MYFDEREVYVKCKEYLSVFKRDCDWEGYLRECVSEYYKSDPESWLHLAGRDGYIYYCPKCKKVVYQNWYKLS